MLHTPSNRGTPVSGENITKIVRQHYKPVSPKPYRPEVVQCRTSTLCKKSKPENYWTQNYHRRLNNLDNGFNTAPTETYRPIGGDLILDPYELVLSALPGNVEKKYQPRMTRRGTIYEPDTPTSNDVEDTKSEKESSCLSEDLIDTCASAGFQNIKKLLQESRDRITKVRSGMAYEDHVKIVEEMQKAELVANQPEDTDMKIHSMSSVYLPIPIKDSPPSTARRSSRSPSLKTSRPSSQQSEPRSPSPGPDLSQRRRIIGYSHGERRKLSVCGRFDCLMVPSKLSKAGHSILRPKRSTENKNIQKLALIQCNSGITETLLRKERQFKDHFLYLKWINNILKALHNMKVKDLRSKIPLSKEVTERLQKEGPCQREEERGSRGAYGSKFSRSTRASTFDIDHDDSARMSVYGTVKRTNAMDTIGKSFFGRRRSKNATSMAGDKPAVETWEDLLNVQPQESKEDPVTFGFQVGIVTKFMRWYRRASVTPVHAGGYTPTIDKETLSTLQQIHEKSTQEQPKAESNYGITHQSLGSAQGHTEKAKKLPIWQQVAQEKSTVFHNKKSKAPNPDTTIQRFRRDLIKLKRSLQKENEAELEKLVRERVASFRLKFSTLNSEECSCLLEEQIRRIQEVKGNVNKSHLENFAVQPSKWYEELRDKSLSMVVSFDQPEINEMVLKLQTYAHMDNKTVPYAKAKLCLLMMSLPAFDICQIYVQKALKFIFENILLGQEAQFNEWLSHRKIPYMVIHEYQRPKSAATTISS